jgi:hypothetical protein
METGNMKEIDLLTTELSGVLPKEEIMEAYNYVMNKDPNNRHNFLFVDLTGNQVVVLNCDMTCQQPGPMMC